MKINENNAGFEAEKLAATFLTERGLTLVAQNYHCRFGEIDLIMKDGKTLVFIEVRLRSNHQFGNAAGSITPKKQQKIILAAQHFLQQHKQTVNEPACRFDAVLMSKANFQSIEWLSNAFET